MASSASSDAKGLAEAVLLLDTDTVERNADSMGVLVDWPGAAAAPQKFAFLVSESRPPACAVDALAVEQEARWREELNALYVALTRARGTLVLSSITPHREAPASWWQRLAAHVGELPAPLPVHVIDPARARDDTRFVLPDLPQATVLTEPTAIETVADEDSLVARIGKAMHRLPGWGGASPARARAVQREFRLDGHRGGRRPTWPSASCKARAPGPGMKHFLPGRATRSSSSSRARP